MKIPQLLLEEINLGEKKAEDYYDKYSKEEFDSALEELRKSDQEILDEYSAEKMNELFVRKSFEKKNEALLNAGAGKKSSKKILTFINPAFIRYAAAAVFVLALASPLAVKMMNPSAGESQTGKERVKGSVNSHHQIRLYRQAGSDAVLLKNGSKAKENDLIQIAYIPGEYEYGVIFSIDGNKNLTKHFPEDSLHSAKLEKTGAEVPLSFSYSLDDAPDYECFIFVASKNEFDLSQIEKIDSSKLSVSFLKKGSYLPENCDGSIFVLKK
jgi:hypothetical protein